MHILIGYGYFPTTTGRYIEQNLAIKHQLTFVGTSGGERPGYLPDVDILEVVHQLTIEPDLFLYIDSGHRSYMPRGIERLSCPTAIYLIDVHLGHKLRKPIAAMFDYVFVAQRDYVSAYRTSPKQYVDWLPLACSPAVHRMLDLPKIYDVGFVGHISSPRDRRAQFLEAIAERFTVNDYHRHYAPEEIAEVYSQSRIVFNCAISGDVNMRVFEAMACGAMLITDRIDNGLFELFQEDKNIITYETGDQLLDRITYYLGHDDERQAIARAGQAEALSHHTYQHRVERVLRVVFEEATGARAPLREATEKQLISHYAQLYSKLRLLDASFDMVSLAFSRKQSRLTAFIQFLGTLLRRMKHG